MKYTIKSGIVIGMLQSSVVSGLLLLGLASCRDLAGTQPLPAGTSSPGVVENAAGAVQTAVAAEVTFQSAFASFIPISGDLTDEFQAYWRDAVISSTGVQVLTYLGPVSLDARQLDQATAWSLESPSGPYASSDTLYATLQRVRGWTSQAIGGLAAYAPDSVVLRGRMYAFMGYTEIMLADLYCSGVPLSTLDFEANYTYATSSTTAQVYQHAIALLDTAQTLAASDSRIVYLSKVGQGRAYLALGEYAAAGQAVSSVPMTFQFVDSTLTCAAGTTCIAQGANVLKNALFYPAYEYSVSDTESGTGLPFISSHDSRTADTLIMVSNRANYPLYAPSKYKYGAISALMLASGLEAQLITAEADLNAGNAVGMFTILNALRQANPATTGLPTLSDPGTFGAELDTLFTERAAWLFADGHRQGDLRRLTRNYVHGQGIAVVANQYPTGNYGFGMGLYGTFIDAPMPVGELANPHFTGCLSRD